MEVSVMGKTVEQKLQGAKEQIRKDKQVIRQLARKVYASDHQVSSLRQQRYALQEEAKLHDAKLQSAEMFISYLAGAAGTNNELKIPLKELYQFMGKNRIVCDKDEEYAIIKLVPFLVPESN
jgi:predicted metal-dependent hydrolase